MGAENVRTILALSPLSRATRLLTGDVVAVPTPKDLLMAIALTMLSRESPFLYFQF